MKTEKALDKIKKLLKLSESPNEYEAAKALSKAQRIALKFDIDLNRISENQKNVFTIFNDDFYFPEWKLDIASMLAFNFDVEISLNTNKTLGLQNLEINTNKEKFDIFLFVYNFTIKSYEILVKQYLQKTKKEFSGLAVAGYHNKLKQRYLVGFIEGLQTHFEKDNEDFYNKMNNGIILQNRNRELTLLSNSDASKKGYNDAKSLKKTDCLFDKK